MNEQQIVEALHDAADNLRLDLWAVARRLDEPESEVTRAFSGGKGFTVDLLVRVAQTLGLEVNLQPASPNVRLVGPVPTVVDQVVLRLTPHLIAQQPSVGSTVRATRGLPPEADSEGEAK